MSFEERFIEPRLHEAAAHGRGGSCPPVNLTAGPVNDYLNLFDRLATILEQAPQTPELLDDLLAWKPVSYRKHFEGSTLPGGRPAIEVYERLDPGFRGRF